MGCSLEDYDSKNGRGWHPPSLCWECARVYANRGCPWANRFEPVPGWDAEETLLISYDGEAHNVRSYNVRACPLFNRDAIIRNGKFCEWLNPDHSPERSDTDAQEGQTETS